jgi:vanillate/3-O-methylgallate O-demethylase
MSAPDGGGWNPAAVPSLQQAIDAAGSPVALLWKVSPEPWMPEVVEREFAGWRTEQAAWHEGVALLDLSHHMSDTFVEGPDATRLLSAVSANNYQKFAVGQAKQFVPVAQDGNIITDGILMRTGENSYTLSGVAAAQNWVVHHGTKGGYDVAFTTDPQSAYRFGGDPTLFRYQVQGPLAADLVERAFAGPIPSTKFFHSTPVSLRGRDLRALRHGMAGQPGYEFVGEWQHAEAVLDALMSAGEPLGLVRVGALAYPTPATESGWIPNPTPAIYTDPDLAGYRQELKVFSYEGQNPLHGSFYSERIEDYYLSPYELGYGRSVSFDHDFVGRDALLRARDEVTRTKVTLVMDPADVRRVVEPGTDMVLDFPRHRVEVGDDLVGVSYMHTSIDPLDAVLGLAVVEKRFAEPGTRVDVVWGEHPGPGTAPDADLGFPRIRATVQPAPYDEHARTRYRRD